MIRILIADDQTLFRSMLEVIIRSELEFELVASAANGKEALEMALLHKPDVAILDVQMPELSGIEVLYALKKQIPQTKVAILTTFEEVESITAASGAGMDGYLIKDMKPEVLIMAIKCIYHDLVLMHQGAFNVLCPEKGTYTQHSQEKVKFGDLTFDRTDLMIIKQIAEGRANKEIAKILNYSEGTIKNKVSNILSMTGLPDRGQIALFAIKNSII